MEDENIQSTMQSVLKTLMHQSFADAFLEPVEWKRWGLLDYPQIIKRPMDLGTIDTKLKRGEYKTFAAFEADVQLVIDNCTTYNDKKAEVYKQAVKLQKCFERELAKIRPHDSTPPVASFSAASQSVTGTAATASLAKGSKQPTTDEKDRFCRMLFQLSAGELGKLIENLDEMCPGAIERIGTDEIDLIVDSIDATSYRKLEAGAKDMLAREQGTGAPAPTSSQPRKKKGRMEDDE